MDNRTIDIISEGDDGLALALQLIWPNAPGGKATHYKMVNLIEKTEYYAREGKVVYHSTSTTEDPKGTPTLILLWYDEHDARELPYALDLAGGVAFVRGWLAHKADYGPEPDHDGHNKRGWRIFTENWGHVAGHVYAIVGVQPAWAMYGK